jgi:hypothetical protein
MAEIDKLLGLRCPHCGAALPEGVKELMKCTYCGTTVRVEDANKYVEHLKGFVIEWIRTALPLGIGAIYSTSVDTLARHNIFIHNILPSLNAEFGRVQSDAFECFATPLISPPFVKFSLAHGRQKDTKTLFSYDAKISSIQPLAVDADDQTIVQRMDGLSRAYAHVLIALDLVDNGQTGLYKIIAENFTVAAKALETSNKILSNRLMALSEVYLSLDDLLSKKFAESRKAINRAKIGLEEAMAKSTLDINLSICVSAIEQELEVTKTVSLILDLMQSNPEIDPLEIMRRIENLFEKIYVSGQVNVPDWKHRFENTGRYSEITKWFCLILAAKSGKTPIKISSGLGSVLFPFWVAEVNYTFGTGALWMKKGKYVRETALIAATFPLNHNFVCLPSEVVTDIFSRRPDGTLAGSILGSETSISTGENISRLVQTAVLRTAAGYTIVPPLSTVSDAKQLMNDYLQQVSGGSGGKLQVASCEVSDIVFVPVDLSTGFIDYHGTLGSIPPKQAGNLSLINSIAV